MAEHMASPDTSHQRQPDNPQIHDVIIIGAGPAGLAVAARLRESTPAAIFTDEEHRRYQWLRRYGDAVTVKHVKSGGTSRRGRVVDPPRFDVVCLDANYDEWLGRWDRLFASYDIKHLRSPLFWHLDPKDRDALLAHAYEHHREGELLEIRQCVGKEVSKHIRKKRARRGGAQQAPVELNERERNDYFNPSQSLFSDHCRAVINRYNLAKGVISKESVQDISFGEVNGAYLNDERLFTVTTDQTCRYARAVVLAVGPANSATIPRFPSMQGGSSARTYPQSCHSTQIEQFPDPVVQKKIDRGEETNIIIVGGGLTSAQLADLAVRRGVTSVWLVMRGACRVKPFDVDLKWMGKYRNVEQAAFWSADSEDERLQMLRAARGGGSITPLFHKKLKEHMALGRLQLRTNTTVADARFEEAAQSRDLSGRWTVKTEPAIEDIPPFDYIYFATGVEPDVCGLPYLRTMLETHPIPVLGGFPVLNHQLMWKDDVPLFVTGRLAALRLGPSAPNLGGAKMGAERIALALQDMVPRQEEGFRGDSSVQVGKQSAWHDYLSGQGNKYGCLPQESHG